MLHMDWHTSSRLCHTRLDCQIVRLSDEARFGKYSNIAWLIWNVIVWQLYDGNEAALFNITITLMWYVSSRFTLLPSDVVLWYDVVCLKSCLNRLLCLC